MRRMINMSSDQRHIIVGALVKAKMPLTTKEIVESVGTLVFPNITYESRISYMSKCLRQLCEDRRLTRATKKIALKGGIGSLEVPAYQLREAAYKQSEVTETAVQPTEITVPSKLIINGKLYVDTVTVDGLIAEAISTVVTPTIKTFPIKLRGVGRVQRMGGLETTELICDVLDHELKPGQIIHIVLEESDED